MISYKPFWRTSKEKNISTYILINKFYLSSSTIDRLRHDKPLSTTTIDDLCRLLNCTICDIIEYIPDEKKRTLIKRVTSAGYMPSSKYRALFIYSYDKVLA